MVQSLQTRRPTCLAAAWALIRAHGYDFTSDAKEQTYKEFGITPL